MFDHNVSKICVSPMESPSNHIISVRKYLFFSQHGQHSNVTFYYSQIKSAIWKFHLMVNSEKP
jgi:hypothetical protein